MSISLILLLVVTLVRLAIFAFVIYAAVQGSRLCGSTTAPRGPKGEGGDPPLAGGGLEGAPGPMQDDPGVRGGVLGRQPSGGEQVGDRNGGPQHLNLLALAKLFGVSAEELLRQVDRMDAEEN